MMPVVATGSVLLRFVFCEKEMTGSIKVDTQVDNVLVAPGMGFNLFKDGEFQ